jgi:hypothetical protein
MKQWEERYKVWKGKEKRHEGISRTWKSKRQKRSKSKRDADDEGKRKHVKRGKTHENIGKEYNK